MKNIYLHFLHAIDNKNGGKLKKKYALKIENLHKTNLFSFIAFSR